MIAEAIPGPNPATRFISRENAFSTLLFSGALIARPPGIAALMIFLSAARREGEPTWEVRKIELPVEFICELRSAVLEGGFCPVYIYCGCPRLGSGDYLCEGGNLKSALDVPSAYIFGEWRPAKSACLGEFYRVWKVIFIGCTIVRSIEQFYL